MGWIQISTLGLKPVYLFILVRSATSLVKIDFKRTPPEIGVFAKSHQAGARSSSSVKLVRLTRLHVLAWSEGAMIKS